MTPTEIHHQNDLDGLRAISVFGWLRASELGCFLYQDNVHARKQGERLARSLADRGLILERLLPERAGRALVLATRGVRVLADAGVNARTGKDIGTIENGSWRPLATWRHDLLAAQVLVDLFKQGWDVQPEHLLRRTAGQLVKLPDGIAFRSTPDASSSATQNDSRVIWLEVEASRKTGPAMRQLADAICTVSAGVCVSVAGHRPTHAVVAYTAAAQDERGYKLDHRARVRAAVAAAARGDVRVTWASCSMRNVNVERIEYQEDVIQADRATKVLGVINAGGWQTDGAELIGRYGGKVVRMVPAGGMWDWEAAGSGGTERTLTEAKRAAASALAL
ncbi:MAG: hypothetical protein K8D98_01750 [Rhodanobacter sp.]|nr:hypothetical protein [Rhodanobacter sp.]